MNVRSSHVLVTGTTLAHFVVFSKAVYVQPLTFCYPELEGDHEHGRTHHTTQTSDQRAEATSMWSRRTAAQSTQPRVAASSAHQGPPDSSKQRKCTRLPEQPEALLCRHTRLHLMFLAFRDTWTATHNTLPKAASIVKPTVTVTVGGRMHYRLRYPLSLSGGSPVAARSSHTGHRTAHATHTRIYVLSWGIWFILFFIIINSALPEGFVTS